MLTSLLLTIEFVNRFAANRSAALLTTKTSEVSPLWSKSGPQDERAKRAKVCGTSGSVRQRFISVPAKFD